MEFSSFQPPSVNLMGPGPSNIYPQVLQALSRPTLGHLDPRFLSMMDEVKALLQYAFQTKNEATFAVSAPGSAGMETCFVNLIEPQEKIIVCVNGVFGQRMAEVASRCQAQVVTVEDDWGQPVSIDKVKAALQQHPDTKFLAFVHAETSTGALSDAKALCQLAQQYQVLSLVDTVTSLGGVELDVDGWGIDAIYSGSQKCLSCVPGLSPVSFSQQAVDKLLSRTTKVQSWFLDLSLVLSYWSDTGKNKPRSYHHTAPVNSLYALHESLLILHNKGLTQSWQQHYTAHEQLKAGLTTLGLNYVVDEQYRLPQLNSVYIPDGVNDGEARKALLANGLEIGGGLGVFAGKVWRIGLMGYSTEQQFVDDCLNQLKQVLS